MTKSPQSLLAKACLLLISLFTLSFGLIGQERDSIIYPAQDLDSLARTELSSGELLSYLAMLERSESRMYAERSLQQDIFGRVILRLLVEASGEVSEYSVYRSLNQDFDAEALRLVRFLPCWRGALRGGKHVRSYYYLPVIFPPLTPKQFP